MTQKFTASERGGSRQFAALGHLNPAQPYPEVFGCRPWGEPEKPCVWGNAWFDDLERISTQTVMDILEVPQRKRTAGTYRHLAKLMAELG